MTGTWPLGWQVGDIEIGAQYGKGIGAISDTTLGGSAASVDITSIVQTYAHLLLVVYARGDLAAALTTLNVRFNGDTAANYDWQRLGGGGTSVSPVEAFAQTSIEHGFVPAASAGANLFSASVGFIPHYAGSSNNKCALSISSSKSGTSSGNMANIFECGFWRSNAAITRVTVLPNSGNFVTGTRVTLYGMGA